jgi:transcriptional regulator with XRE-family HTH domain
MSLLQVEVASNGEFKTSVLGAYERAERSISVPRLQRLAKFYGVPIDVMLPPRSPPSLEGGPWVPGGITIDLAKLHRVSAPQTKFLERFLGCIQEMRQDFTRRTVTIRREDLRLVASVLNVTPDDFGAGLDRVGLRSAMHIPI